MHIKVRNLNYIYQEGLPFETSAVSNVNFDIEEGEFAAIIGHTGSGKTTLVMNLAGLLKPSSGTIDADKKKIGIVFQYPEYQLFEETVIKDVCFGPKNLGLDEEQQKQRAKEALALVGFDYEAKGEYSPFNLSGGEKRRAAIAGVLAMKPEVLILDEPTAGLDPKGHEDILLMLERIRLEKKITIILISHNMDDVARFADHILVMDKGKLLMDGSPKDVFSRAKELEEAGLGLPFGKEIIYKLQNAGIKIDSDALGFDEAKDALIKYYGN